MEFNPRVNEFIGDVNLCSHAARESREFARSINTEQLRSISVFVIAWL